MATDFSQYAKGRRQVDRQWGAQRAAQDYGRFVGQQQHARRESDYRRDFGRGQNRFMGQAGARGLTGGGINSGSFQQALQRRVGDFTQGLGRMNEDAANDARRWDMESANMNQWRTDALTDIEDAKTRDIAMSALQIQALRPLFGG